MQLSKLENHAYEELKKNNLTIFRIIDLCRIININKLKAYNLIKSLKEKRAIDKVGNGYYAFKGSDEYAIATRIHWPAYISFWSALNYYGFSDQNPKKIYIATTKFKKNTINFHFVTISKKRFFGYKQAGELVIAEKEKAIIDSLLFPRYSGGIKEIEKAIEASKTEININKLIDYSLKIGSKVVVRRLGYLLEKRGYKNKKINELNKKIGKGYERLDPSLTKKNNLNSRWLVDINY